MNLQVIIIFILWMLSIEIINYLNDKRDFNKGVCPKCGKPMKLRDKNGVTNTYMCSNDHCWYLVCVSSIYLRWRYGRKLKRMAVIEFLESTHKPIKDSEFLETRPRIECKDGFSISVQAGYGKYSMPSTNIETGEYFLVELGYPSEPDVLINHYADDKTNYKNTIYPYVPVVVVERLIEKHGGVKCYG